MSDDIELFLSVYTDFLQKLKDAFPEVSAQIDEHVNFVKESPEPVYIVQLFMTTVGRYLGSVEITTDILFRHQLNDIINFIPGIDLRLLWNNQLPVTVQNAICKYVKLLCKVGKSCEGTIIEKMAQNKVDDEKINKDEMKKVMKNLFLSNSTMNGTPESDAMNSLIDSVTDSVTDSFSNEDSNPMDLVTKLMRGDTRQFSGILENMTNDVDKKIKSGEIDRAKFATTAKEMGNKMKGVCQQISEKSGVNPMDLINMMQRGGPMPSGPMDLINMMQQGGPMAGGPMPSGPMTDETLAIAGQLSRVEIVKQPEKMTKNARKRAKRKDQ